jgi:hypothetical protein
MAKMEPSLDIVISWVDGQDPRLAAKRQDYAQGISRPASSSTRFAANDEIYYAIASILKYVAFCRRILIVTDQQQPAWLNAFAQEGLCAEDKIQIIDHRQLFQGYEQVLPTFNSLTIETMLWNIPDLSPQFIYLNDDFFFNAPASLSDFVQQQQLVVYGHWQSNTVKKFKYQLRRCLERYWGQKAEAKYSTAQMLSADLLGMSRYYAIHHRPHVLDKSLLAEYFAKHPQLLMQQIQHRFRDHSQFLPVGLANHLLILAQQAQLKADVAVAYLKPKDGLSTFLQQLAAAELKYGCIQSLDLFSPLQQQQLRSALVDKFSDCLPQVLIDQEDQK